MADAMDVPSTPRQSNAPVTVTRGDEDEPVRLEPSLSDTHPRSLDRVLRNTVIAHSATAVQ